MNTQNFFQPYFNNSELNSMLIMECDGTVIEVNSAFKKNFGYDTDDLKGRSFEVLFTQEDKGKKLPSAELEKVNTRGQATDENYVVDKQGNKIWALGESLFIDDEKGGKYIVKDLVNLQAKRQLQLFLMQAEELLERIFESSTDIPMMVVDGSMKIMKANTAFITLFEIAEEPRQGSRLSELDHSFWKSNEIKAEISAMIVNNQPLRRKEHEFVTKAGQQKKIILDSRIFDKQTPEGKSIFILIEDITD